VRRGWFALAGGLLVASCDDVNVHILSGSLYNEQLGCVSAPAGVDVVQGASNGDTCSPQCLVASGEDQTYVYVTTDCPPYPGDYIAEALDAAADDSDPCFGALAAYNDYQSDGGVCPATAPDAGGEASAEAGTEAGVDATMDAPAMDAPAKDAPAVDSPAGD
jgi:hypothetical protein